MINQYMKSLAEVCDWIRWHPQEATVTKQNKMESSSNNIKRFQTTPGVGLCQHSVHQEKVKGQSISSPQPPTGPGEAHSVDDELRPQTQCDPGNHGRSLPVVEEPGGRRRSEPGHCLDSLSSLVSLHPLLSELLVSGPDPGPGVGSGFGPGSGSPPAPGHWNAPPHSEPSAWLQGRDPSTQWWWNRWRPCPGGQDTHNQTGSHQAVINIQQGKRLQCSSHLNKLWSVLVYLSAPS